MLATCGWWTGPAVTLYAYDLASEEVKRVLNGDGADIKSASACADAIAFDRIDGLYLYDLKSGEAKKLAVTVRGDLPGVRPRVEKVGRGIQHDGLSPTGAGGGRRSRSTWRTSTSGSSPCRCRTATTSWAARAGTCRSPAGRSAGRRR